MSDWSCTEFSSFVQANPVEQHPTTESAVEEAEEVIEYTQDDIVDTGITAIALYDYQAAASDEISFDPDDIVTHIEKVTFLLVWFLFIQLMYTY